MTLLAAINPAMLFLAGCAVLTWVLLRRTYRACGRRPRIGEQVHLEHLHRPTDPWEGAQRDTSAQVERQKVELYDMARDATGRIDSKLMLLQQMIDQNQRRIDRMEELLGELERASEAATSRGCPIVVANDGPLVADSSCVS